MLLLLSIGAALGSACQSGTLEVYSTEVARGVSHHQVHLLDGPWRIHVLEIDLPKAWAAGIRLRTASAAEGGIERTSVLAQRALAAINGDFFVSYKERIRVAGLEISDGRLLQPPYRRSAFAITRDGVPLIGIFRFEAGLITGSGQLLPIAGLAQKPEASELTLFAYHSQTLQDSVHAAVGFQLQSLGANAAINDTIAVRVLQRRLHSWPLLLEPDQWLVAAGADHLHHNWIVPGDTLQLFLRLIPVNDHFSENGQFQEALGGGPRILRDGQVSVEHAQERLNEQFAKERHPRTAIGYSQNSRVLFLITVDGRQPGYSVGMNLAELAQFMRFQLGKFSRSREHAYQGLNLDGGGSTTMVLRRQVINRPSDQLGERPVANVLLVVGPGGVSL